VEFGWYTERVPDYLLLDLQHLFQEVHRPSDESLHLNAHIESYHATRELDTRKSVTARTIFGNGSFLGSRESSMEAEHMALYFGTCEMLDLNMTLLSWDTRRRNLSQSIKRPVSNTLCKEQHWQMSSLLANIYWEDEECSVLSNSTLLFAISSGSVLLSVYSFRTGREY